MALTPHPVVCYFFKGNRTVLSADTASKVPHTEPQRGASERNRRLRRLLARRSDRVVYLLDDAVVCKVKLAEGEKQCGCPI